MCFHIHAGYIAENLVIEGSDGCEATLISTGRTLAYFCKFGQ